MVQRIEILKGENVLNNNATLEKTVKFGSLNDVDEELSYKALYHKLDEK